MRVVTIGTGYVGINTAVALSYVGHSVVGVDVDEAKVALLKSRRAPISETGLDELLAIDDRISFTSDLGSCIGDADVVFIAVGTPSAANGEANISYVLSAADEIGALLTPTHDVTIVVKSTVPVGVNAMIARQIRGVVGARGGDVSHLHFASNPEFLREGCALHDTFYPDRFVIGTEDEKAYTMLCELFEPILMQTFEPPQAVESPEQRTLPQCLHTDQVSAEMVKYASNVFLALKISYANEIAGLCEKIGANMSDVSRGMGMDKRIAPAFLRSGLGWGGSCFPKDSKALLHMAQDYSYPMPIVTAAVEVNSRQKDRLILKLLDHLHVLVGQRIAVLGLSFKPRTDDVRNSPSVDVADILVQRGARVRVHDPKGLENARHIYAENGFEFFDTAEEAVRGVDAIVIATEWDDYKSLDWAEIRRNMAGSLLLDARNLLRGTGVEQLFDYCGL